MAADPRTDDGSWGIMLGVSTLALVAATCLDAALVPAVAWRLAVVAVLVAVIAERTADARPAIGAAVVGFALADGFLQHDGGTLGWDTRLDYPFALGLVGAAALGMCAGQLRLAGRRRRRLRPFTRMLRDAGPPWSRSPLRKHQESPGPVRQPIPSGRGITDRPDETPDRRAPRP